MFEPNENVPEDEDGAPKPNAEVPWEPEAGAPNGEGAEGAAALDGCDPNPPNAGVVEDEGAPKLNDGFASVAFVLEPAVGAAVDVLFEMPPKKDVGLLPAAEAPNAGVVDDAPNADEPKVGVVAAVLVDGALAAKANGEVLAASPSFSSAGFCVLEPNGDAAEDEGLLGAANEKTGFGASSGFEAVFDAVPKGDEVEVPVDAPPKADAVVVLPKADVVFGAPKGDGLDVVPNGDAAVVGFDVLFPKENEGFGASADLAVPLGAPPKGDDVAFAVEPLDAPPKREGAVPPGPLGAPPKVFAVGAEFVPKPKLGFELDELDVAGAAGVALVALALNRLGVPGEAPCELVLLGTPKLNLGVEVVFEVVVSAGAEGAAGALGATGVAVVAGGAGFDPTPKSNFTCEGAEGNGAAEAEVVGADDVGFANENADVEGDDC